MPPPDASSSGWACTAIRVRGSAIPPACHVPGCALFRRVLIPAGFWPSRDGLAASGRRPHGERTGSHRYRECPVRGDDLPVHLAGEYRAGGDLHLARLESFQLPVLVATVREDPGGYPRPAERAVRREYPHVEQPVVNPRLR